MLRTFAFIGLAAITSAKVAKVNMPKPTEAVLKNRADFAKTNAAVLYRARNMKSAPNLGQTDQCAGYSTEEACRDESPESALCVWALPHGNSNPDDEEDEVCRRLKCHDINNDEFNEGGGDQEQECNHFLGGICEFHEDPAWICWERGQTLDCEFRGYWQESDCTNNGCVWHAESYMCTTPGAVEPCGNSGWDESSCSQISSDCTWAPGAPDSTGYSYCGVCYNRSRFGSTAPCDAYLDKGHECCPTSRCRWTVTELPPTDEPGMPNDEPDMNDEVDFETGVCTDQNEVVACEEFRDNQDCIQQSRCEWIAESEWEGICNPRNRQIACERFNAQECSNEDRCSWMAGTTEDPEIGDDGMGYCISCPQGQNCTQTYNGPGSDDGQPCSTHNEMNCPIEGGRCALHFAGGEDPGDSGDIDYNNWQCASNFNPGAGGSGTCVDPICEDENEQESCQKLSTCSWNSNCNTCYTTGQPFPCDACFEQSGCSSDNNCEWHPGTSNCNEGEEPGETSGGSCSVSGTNPSCKSVEAFSSACCPSYCQWDESRGTCNDANYQPSCESYGTEGCPSGRSDCTETLGICHKSSSTITCNDICNAFVCSATGSCNWDDSREEGQKCATGAAVPVQCSSLSIDDCYSEAHEECTVTEGRCTQATCEQMSYEEVCGVYSRPCGSGDSANTCNCQWHAESGCYYAGEDLPCNKYYEQSDCPTDRCHFDTQCYRCLDGDASSSTREQCPCHTYWDDSCPAGRCTLTSAGMCEIASQNVQPPSLNGGGDHDQSHCTSSLKVKVAGALDAAADDCMNEEWDATSASESQLKCLSTYLGLVSSSFTEACPCLYYWALHEAPDTSAWMAVNC